MMLKRYAVSLVMVGLVTGACSSEEDTATVSQDIVAAEGGMVELAGAMLDIPQNALAQDTTITMGYVATADVGTLEGAYDQALSIGPVDAVLTSAVSLVVDFGDINDGSRVYRFVDGVDGGWIPLTGTPGSGGVELEIDSLGHFALVTPQTGIGSIAGTVLWAGNGSPVVEATVQLLQDGVVLTYTSTDAEGAFQFAELASGSYQVRIEDECPVTTSVEVAAGEPTAVAINLCEF